MKTKLTFLIAAFFMFSLISSVFAQNWQSNFAPYYRNVNKVLITDNDRFFAAGGWESNDSISSIFYSDDSCQNWTISLDLVNAFLHDIDFPSQQIGYAVGDAGTFFKTIDNGSTWNQINISGNVGTRTYNAVHFFDDNNGIIVGGNESNDAIQTIIKTTDGGTSWTIISDNLNPWLRDVFFIDNNNGFAVGDQGTILKTTDGGDTWQTLTTPGNINQRRLNRSYFISDQIGIITGGHPSNDSIQTMIKTIDGGNNWTIIKDDINPMLNSVYFFDSMHGYAVGDWGKVLYTDDQGDTWADLNIAVNDDYHLKDVFFKNNSLGTIGGYSGKMLTYIDASGSPANVTIESPVIIVDSVTAFISGEINPNGTSTDLEFEYGTDITFGTTEQISNGLTGSSLQNISFYLNNLNENTLYYGRLKASNTYGTSYSDVVLFYTGVNTIPNFNFEVWDDFSSRSLDVWENAGTLSQITSYDGTYAVQLNSNNGDPGAILYGTAGGNGLSGGIPYTSRPDSLTAWLNYDINANDTALIIVQLKENGTNMVADTIYKLTGSTGGVFQYHSFKINYLNSNTPDTLLLGFVNTNAFSSVDPLSVMSVDNISFINSTETLPNSDMELWTEIIRSKAESWSSKDDFYQDQPFFVDKTTDSHSGNYALKLSNKIGNWTEYGRVKTGDSTEWSIPEFPVNYRHEFFHGYYKFFPENNDSLFIQTTFYKNGSQIGNAMVEISQLTTTYQLFSSPIYYYNGETPDSASIEIFMGKDNFSGVPSNSYAIIDNLSFDGIISTDINYDIKDVVNEKLDFNIYPNPTSGIINIEISEILKNSNGEIMLVDLYGKKHYHNKLDVNYKETFEMDLSMYPNQLYILVFKIDNKIYSKKIIKK